MDINSKLKKIVAGQLRIDSDDITDNTDLVDDLGADSLDVVEILMSVEENFGVTVPDEEIPNLHTISDLQAYIEENM